MKTVLITGATGVIGSALVPYFLKEPDTEVIILARAASDEHLGVRLQALKNYWADEVSQDAAKRLKGYRGDVTLTRLGLTAAEYQSLLEQVTHIVHCAGNVKMNMSEEEATKISVASTEHILSMMEELHRRNPAVKLDYVSTLGVAGKMRGLVPEQPLSAQPGYHNTYESSKAEAERLVLSHMDQGLQVTVHRPSMVVGDSRSGKIISFQVFYHLSDFIAGKHSFGIIPNTRSTLLDLIPLDYVAKAIHWSSGNPEATGKILHLCSGPEQAIDIALLARQLQRMANARGEKLPKLRIAPVALFRVLIPVLKSFAPKRVASGLGNLPLFLDYIEDAQLFENSATRELLTRAGITVPAVESYLAAITSYHASRRREKTLEKSKIVRTTNE